MEKPNFFILGAQKCGTTALYEPHLRELEALLGRDLSHWRK